MSIIHVSGSQPEVFCADTVSTKKHVGQQSNHLPHKPTSFYVSLTVQLSIFILVINHIDAQNLFYNKFLSCLHMFRAPCAHRQDVKIVLYSLW